MTESLPIKPSRQIDMLFCRIDIGESWISTHFADGTSYGAEPHDTPEYYALSVRCGYGGGQRGLMQYCKEHEIAHSLIGEIVFKGPSRVIWGCAHGNHATMAEILAEEALAVELQSFARANRLPASSAPGFSWFKVRDRFLELCDDHEFNRRKD